MNFYIVLVVALGMFLNCASSIVQIWGWPVYWTPIGAVSLAMTFLILLACLSLREGGHRIQEPPTQILGNVEQKSCCLAVSMKLLMAFGIVALLISFVAAGLKGVVDTSSPIMSPKSEYLLDSHGTLTPVTELRYRIIGISRVIAFASFLLWMNCLCLSSVCCPSRKPNLRI